MGGYETQDGHGGCVLWDDLNEEYRRNSIRLSVLQFRTHAPVARFLHTVFHVFCGPLSRSQPFPPVRKGSRRWSLGPHKFLLKRQWSHLG
jgi:hypothetical protein